MFLYLIENLYNMVFLWLMWFFSAFLIITLFYLLIAFATGFFGGKLNKYGTFDFNNSKKK